MKLQGEITVEQMLSDFRQFPNRIFWLCFVRATGKQAGELKIVARCRYGAPRHVSEGAAVNQDGTPRKIWLHVDKGTIPLTDADKGEYLTPLISHIVGYNLKKVIHSWKTDTDTSTETAKPKRIRSKVPSGRPRGRPRRSS